MPIRIDTAGQIQAFKKLPNGWVLTEGYPAKVGILTYKTADGGIIREFRSEEELFSSETMDSFKMLPVTLGHPSVGKLTAENTKFFQVGHLGDSCRRQDDKVAVPIALTDAEAIQEATTRAHELSWGYQCEIEDSPGVWQGQPYDRKQRKVKGNHVALVQKGRAGADCHIRLDAVDNAVVDSAPQNEGGEFPAKSESLPGQPSRNPEPPQVRLDAIFGMLDAERLAHQAAQKELREVRAELEDLKKQRADSLSEEKISTEISARMALVEKARRFSPELKLDSWEPVKIQTAAIASVYGEFAKTLEGKSPDYISGVFESLAAQRSDSNIVRINVEGDHFFSRSDALKQGTEQVDHKQDFLDAANDSWKKGLK